MRVSDPVPVGDDDECRVGALANGLRDRVDRPLRMRLSEGLAHLWDLRDGPGDRERLPSRLPVELRARLQDRDGHARAQRHEDDRQLQQDDLRREAQPAPDATFAHQPIVWGGLGTNARKMDKRISTQKTAMNRRNYV